MGKSGARSSGSTIWAGSLGTGTTRIQYRLWGVVRIHVLVGKRAAIQPGQISVTRRRRRVSRTTRGSRAHPVSFRWPAVVVDAGNANGGTQPGLKPDDRSHHIPPSLRRVAQPATPQPVRSRLPPDFERGPSHRRACFLCESTLGNDCTPERLRKRYCVEP